HVHHQLCDVEKEAEKLSSGSFTEEQLRHLQNKLHHIDERYKEGCVTESHMKGDPYEEDGQAAVADIPTLHSRNSRNAIKKSIPCSILLKNK
ncbi:hypothetical protein INT44_000608, partial [Umbelopsis vinacea]